MMYDMQETPQEKEIQNLRRRLVEAEDALSEFTHMVSHDISAPLRAVVNFSKLLKEKYVGALDERGERYLGFVTEGANRAQAMLSALAHYSRLTTHKTHLAFVDCEMLVEQCRQALADKIGQSLANIRLEPLPTVLADEEQLRKLFLALIDNALTYRRPDTAPDIKIYAKETATGWIFYVEDNGIGIDPGSKDRIFQVFRRLHMDTEFPGLGMGLAVARRIAEQHGGTVGMTPRSGFGTTFWFTLPKSKAHMQTEAQNALAAI